MGLLNDVGAKAKNLVSGNRDKIDKGLAKAGDLANRKTKGKHQDKIEQGLAKVSEGLDKVEAEEKNAGPGAGPNPAPGGGTTQNPTTPPQS